MLACLAGLSGRRPKAAAAALAELVVGAGSSGRARRWFAGRVSRPRGGLSVLAERSWGLKPSDPRSSVSRSMATRAFDFQKMLGSRTGPTASDWADVLADLPLFARVSKRRLRKIASLSQIQRFSPGDIVVEIGKPADAFYLILAGRAKVVGKSRRTLGIGDYFGEMGLIDGEPRSATIAAAGELETMKLARRPFLKLLKQEPQIAMSMMAELAARIRSLERRPIL